MELKLGKLPPKHDPRTLKLAKYFTPSITPARISNDYSKGLKNWGMMLNDSLGDCTMAGVGHAIQVVTLNTTGIITVTDAQILKYYEWFCGYINGNPDTDNGGVELDVLTLWRKWGFNGHPLLAYASVNPLSREHVRKAIELFGFVYIGIQLPITAQDQIGGLWTVIDRKLRKNSAPGSWGGHAIIALAYDQDTITVVTWGQLQVMTWEFWDAYVDEVYALLMGYVVDHPPEVAGFSIPDLQQDLAVVTG